MEALKKSRSAYSGAVTRIWNRYDRLLEEDPSLFDHGQLEHKLESIHNTDLSYHKIHEEISLAGEGTLSPEEEQETLETFEDSVERTRSLLTRLIAIQTLSNLSSEIQFDLEELDSKMQAHPDRDYSATLSTITTTLKELKLALGKSTINRDHQLRRVAKYLSSQESYHPKKRSYQALPLPLPSVRLQHLVQYSYQRSLSQHLRETL